MKVLLINGSPHENGTTSVALKEVEQELNLNGIETEVFWIGNKAISGCIGCYSCSKIGKCVIDDVVNQFVEKASSADGFIFGTPVHYAGMSGLLTSFMDRAFYSAGCSGNQCFKFKPVASVICARRAGTTATYDQINKYFGITQMPIISTRYWNMAFGRNADDVKKDEEGLQSLRILARNMSYYLKCIEAGKEKGITPPEQEKVTFTNFIR
ncbi:MAG: flavodoxin family protein [Clostridia bacterium]|nr:flavodoxin family protein [Clostridia bacterium]